MKQYHKIQTVFKRDPETNFKKLLINEYSIPEFYYLNMNKWVFTEKVDGTNIRVVCRPLRNGHYDVTFKGKTDNASIPAGLVKNLEDNFHNEKMIKKLISKLPNGACLYGEGYGAKIQNGGKYREDQGFVLFDVNIGGYWLNRSDVEDVAAILGIDVVPVVGEGTLIDMVEIAKEGFSSRWGNFLSEGIVARPKIELKTRGGERIITKIKYKDFNRD